MNNSSIEDAALTSTAHDMSHDCPVFDAESEALLENLGYYLEGITQVRFHQQLFLFCANNAIKMRSIQKILLMFHPELRLGTIRNSRLTFARLVKTVDLTLAPAPPQIQCRTFLVPIQSNSYYI